MKVIYQIVLMFLCYFPLYSEVKLIGNNVYDVLNFVKSNLPKDPIILEAGAFNGNDTIIMAQYWPSGKIYSFEPVPKLFSILSETTRPYKNIKIYQLALADVSGKLTFYLGDYVWNKPSGSSSLLPAKEHKEVDHEIVFNNTMIVDAITIDEWAIQENIHYVDFMWLDMQGYELNTLKASNLIKNVGVIYLEVEFIEAYEGQYLYPEIKQWMELNGFELIALDFDESIPFTKKDLIKIHSLPYYGNAIFLNKNYKMN